LRAFLEVDGTIVDQREGPGISGLEVAPIVALRAAVHPWQLSEDSCPVLMCGMVGSRNGIIEVPYVGAPVGSQEWADHCVSHHAGEFDLTIAPGVRGHSHSGAPEVMRGEEAQIFGAFRSHASLRQGHHLLLLPGTHSKWVDVRNGELTSFQTFITGELFALLRDHSSLLRTGDSKGESDTGFQAGVERARSAGVAESLFETRSAQLLLERTQGWARGFLSGVLIGGEVAAVVRTRTIRGTVTVIGEQELSALYRQALGFHGIETAQLEGDQCAIAGLGLLPTIAARVN
jgi:2-dehydro-3-deoxygalactonokinase